jgi:hypothetical protein
MNRNANINLNSKFSFVSTINIPSLSNIFKRTLSSNASNASNKSNYSIPTSATIKIKSLSQQLRKRESSATSNCSQSSNISSISKPNVVLLKNKIMNKSIFNKK